MSNLLNYQNMTVIILVALQTIGKVPVAAGTSQLFSTMSAVSSDPAANTHHPALIFPHPHREGYKDPFLASESDNVLEPFFYCLFLL
jgi:hypothetical protein